MVQVIEPTSHQLRLPPQELPGAAADGTALVCTGRTRVDSVEAVEAAGRTTLAGMDAKTGGLLDGSSTSTGAADEGAAEAAAPTDRELGARDDGAGAALLIAGGGTSPPPTKMSFCAPGRKPHSAL